MYDPVVVSTWCCSLDLDSGIEKARKDESGESERAPTLSKFEDVPGCALLSFLLLTLHSTPSLKQLKNVVRIVRLPG